MHLSQMFDAMARGELTCAYIIGENPMSSEADTHHTRKMLEGLECLVVQDIVLTETAKAADVVLPGTASWCESEGTVTNSERRVQRVRKAIEPPGDARDDIAIIAELARRLGSDWGHPTPQDLWEELRTLSPMHAGMSYEKIERLGGVQWPCPDEESEGTLFLHARLWEEDPAKRGAPAPFHLTAQDDPLDTLTGEYPIRLTTGRRLDSYNTGVASNAFATPLRRKETLNLSPEDVARLGFAEDEFARVTSRRGSIIAAVYRGHDAAGGAGVHDPALPRPGGDQHPHAGHLGPEVGHRGVQGDRDPGGEGVPRGGGRRHRANEGRGGDALVDLRLTAKVAATEAERAAVDAVLGPPESGWEGGERQAADAHAAYGGRAARGRRHLLITVLHAVQEKAGWISPGALDYVCERLTVPPADAFGVASFYALFRTAPSPGAVVHVCDDVACQVGGAEELCAEMTRRFGREGADAELNGTGVTWQRSPCLGQCDRGSAALIQHADGDPARLGLAPATPEAIWSALTEAEAPPEPPVGSLVPQLSENPPPSSRTDPWLRIAGRADSAPERPVTRATPGGGTGRRCPGPARCRCCGASAGSIPRRSGRTGRRAATRCSAGPSASARRAWSARSATRS